MLINKQEIARLIPHAGTMCLLDGVLEWDEARIRCMTTSHQAPDNPLRHKGRLGILSGVEYAAQAMALHGALSADQTAYANTARVGFLASLRAVIAHADRLDLLLDPINVSVDRLHGDAERAIYQFALSHSDHVLLEGRAAVILQTIPA